MANSKKIVEKEDKIKKTTTSSTSKSSPSKKSSKTKPATKKTNVTKTSTSKPKTTAKKTGTTNSVKKTKVTDKTSISKNTSKSIKTVKKSTDIKTTILSNDIKIKSVNITEIPKNEQIEYITVKRKKLNKKNLVLLIILLISIILLFIALFNVIFWFIDNGNINKQIDDINYVTKVEVINDNENTEIIEQDNIKKSDPYWDYIKMDMINVDFDELLSVNKDTKGWIQVNGTNVNYPFVQTTNNDYYLTHAFDKSWNDAGWVFLDYRNNLSNRDKNTIIYGHSRLNKTMFGSLKNILTSGWLDNTDNYVIKLSTQYENTLWQIFSVYHIPTTNDYIQTDFKDNSEFYSFATMLLNRSQHNFNTTISENDQILTLSTCYKNDEKLAIHAKLIKKESR